MKQRLPRLLLLVALAMLLAACSDQPGKQWAAKKRARAALKEQPLPAKELVIPPRGDLIFAENCLKCHTVGGKGSTVGPDLSKIGSRRSGEYLEQVIREPSAVFPGTVMPAAENLSVEQVEALVDYLLTLK